VVDPIDLERSLTLAVDRETSALPGTIRERGRHQPLFHELDGLYVGQLVKVVDTPGVLPGTVRQSSEDLLAQLLQCFALFYVREPPPRLVTG
jgi:hypothetical protein